MNTKQKNEFLESFKNARIPKKIDSKTSLSKLINYCETIDFTCEPDFRYIIPLAYINHLKSLKQYIPLNFLLFMINIKIQV